MKLITAIIQPYKLEEVKDTLNELGIDGLTITEVQGFGRQKGYKQQHLVLSEDGNLSCLLRKTKIELVVSDSAAEPVIACIVKAAKTGEIGDGKIFITHVEDAIRIRTEERGREVVVAA